MYKQVKEGEGNKSGIIQHSIGSKKNILQAFSFVDNRQNTLSHMGLYKGTAEKIQVGMSTQYPLVKKTSNQKHFIQRKIDYSEKIPDYDALYSEILKDVFWLDGVTFYKSVKRDEHNNFQSGEEYDPIQELIDEIIKKKGKPWTAYEAKQAIIRVLTYRFPMPPRQTSNAGKWDLTPDEFKWYIIQNFKTISTAVLDSTLEYKGLSGTDDEGTHSEMHSLGQMGEHIERAKWGEEHLNKHTMVLWLNNSPCFYKAKCAQNIAVWPYLKFFKSFTIKFLNPYEIGKLGEDLQSGFKKSIEELRSVGISVEPIQVGELPDYDLSEQQSKIIASKIRIAEKALNPPSE